MLRILSAILLCPLLSAQDVQEPTPFERLLPEQPLVEFHLENPAKLWKDLVKSRVGRVLASASLAEVHKAWKRSFELRLLQEELGNRLGLTKTASLALFRDLQAVKGSVRLGWFARPGFGGWVLEVDAEPLILERVQEHLTTAFGESPAEGKAHVLGQESQVFKQKSGPWFHVAPVLLGERLYFSAWQHPDGAKILSRTPGPWMSTVGLVKKRSLIQRNRMPLMVSVDLRRIMEDLRERIADAKEKKGRYDETLQMAQLIGFHATSSVAWSLDVKRGRILQEFRAEVPAKGRFASFLGALIPREGRAIDLMAFQTKGPRTSVFISVDPAKAHDEIVRLFSEGMRDLASGEEEDLEQICEQMMGFSFKKDLFGPLDGRVLFFEGEGGADKKGGFCFGLGTKDPAKTAEVVDKLVQSAGMQEGDVEEFEGFRIHQFDLSFLWSKLVIRYVLTKQFFLLAVGDSGHQYMQRIIGREKAAQESRFRPQGDLKSQLMLVPQESATIVWADTLIAASSLLGEWAARLERVSSGPDAKTQGDSERSLATLSKTLVPLLRKEGLATTLSALGRDRHGFWIRWVW